LDGFVTCTKVALQAVMQAVMLEGMLKGILKVYEPILAEMVAYGLSLENSDFGNGAVSVRAYLLRIGCSNRCLRYCINITALHLHRQPAFAVGVSEMRR
jgi:hypothetical protein